MEISVSCHDLLLKEAGFTERYLLAWTQKVAAHMFHSDLLKVFLGFETRASWLHVQAAAAHQIAPPLPVRLLIVQNPPR